MDPDTGLLVCRVGDEVVGSDEGTIGTVAAFDPRTLTVERRVYLNVRASTGGTPTA